MKKALIKFSRFLGVVYGYAIRLFSKKSYNGFVEAETPVKIYERPSIAMPKLRARPSPRYNTTRKKLKGYQRDHKGNKVR